MPAPWCLPLAVMLISGSSHSLDYDVSVRRKAILNNPTVLTVQHNTSSNYHDRARIPENKETEWRYVQSGKALKVKGKSYKKRKNFGARTFAMIRTTTSMPFSTTLPKVDWTSWLSGPQLIIQHFAQTSNLTTAAAKRLKKGLLNSIRQIQKRPHPQPSNRRYEEKLGEEDDEAREIKTFATMKNPLKYIAKNGVMFKKAQNKRIATSLLGTRIFRLSDPTKSSSYSSSRGNLILFVKEKSESLRRKPSAPVSPPRYSPLAFNLRRSSCYTNTYGFQCCNQQLEVFMKKSFKKMKRNSSYLSPGVLAERLKSDAIKFFKVPFEALVSEKDFYMTAQDGLFCKTRMEKYIVAVYIGEKWNYEANKGRATKINAEGNVLEYIPYHELSRDVLMKNASVILARLN